MSYVQGKYGQLYIISAPPSGNKMLTAEGWSDKQQYDEALVALATGAGTSGVAVTTSWEPIQAGSLTIGGSGWVDNGAINNNEVKYTGFLSGANHWFFDAKINYSSTVANKEIDFRMLLNSVAMPCSDVYYETRNGTKSAILTGCGVIGTDDVVSMEYKSPDGATITIETVRWMAKQAR